MTETVYLGLGSNTDPEKHLAAGINALRSEFNGLRLSPFYRSKAVGFDGADFLNGCAAIETGLDPLELKAWLTALEDANGRRRDMPRFSDRTLDIDILLHGERVGDFDGLVLPRPEILKYAHVLKPLADLAGDVRHPETGRSFADHWVVFEGACELVRVEL